MADATNAFLAQLYHKHLEEPELPSDVLAVTQADAQIASVGAIVLGGIDSEEEDRLITRTNDWVMAQGLPEGEYLYELVDEYTGNALAIFDLAWPHGLQVELSEPVALLINEGSEVLQVANAKGFRYFTNVDTFKAYVQHQILAEEELVV